MSDAIRIAKSIKPAIRVKLMAGGVPPENIAPAQPAMPAPAPHPFQNTINLENRRGVNISPVPGKQGRIASEAKYLDPNIKPDDALSKWNPSTPNLIGAPVPPPVQVPVHNEPRLPDLMKGAQKIFSSKSFNDFIEKHTGLRDLQVTPIHGMYEGEREPSFILQHPNMTDEHAHFLANALGFGMQQDSAIHIKHNPNIEEGIPSMLVGTGDRLNKKQIDGIMNAAKDEGLDGASSTLDGKAIKFLHFGGEEKLPEFYDKIDRVMQRTNMPHKALFHSSSEMINNEDYIKNLRGAVGSGARDTDSAGEPSDLFRGIVGNVLAPYAKAVAGEGYRLSPQRLAETHDLSPQEKIHVQESLYPSGRKVDDRSTVPLMTGEENLDIRPTGNRGQNTVGDLLFGLQNRAAKKGQIEAGDFSDEAKKKIANIMAKEVQYHVANSDKSAIGWYDAALKKAMDQYHSVFPELKTDPQKEMLFKAILGITSQGADVHTNSVQASRLYSLIRDKGMSLPEATNAMTGSFGKETNAIENNLHKFHHLLTTNGFDKMKDIMGQKKTVGEWNRILRKSKNLYDQNGEPLQMQGGANQKVTGWSVFGPKIGSFINNLHGDYSTLTSDLWFSRTWNRMLGHNFIHAPLAEQKQYQEFKDALMAEYHHSNPNVKIHENYKTEGGKFVSDPERFNQPAKWLYGNDASELSKEEFDNMINDPEKMREYAEELHDRFKGGQFKEKSDLRRRAKNWIESRENPIAAPRGDKERDFQQNTAEEAQKILKKRGLDISIADIQAALWFHEKELFGKYGVATERSKPADYEDAAKNTVNMIQGGDLFKNKTKEKKPKKGAAPPPPEEPQHDAFGGSVRGAYKSGGHVSGGFMPHHIPGVHIVTADAGEPIFSGRK